MRVKSVKLPAASAKNTPRSAPSALDRPSADVVGVTAEPTSLAGALMTGTLTATPAAQAGMDAFTRLMEEQQIVLQPAGTPPSPPRAQQPSERGAADGSAGQGSKGARSQVSSAAGQRRTPPTPAKARVNANILTGETASRLRQPRTVALLGTAGALALGVGARLGFGLSLLESAFWSATFAGLGLGAASFLRLSNQLGEMRRIVEHTRKHMATTARVLSETLEQAESLNALAREAPPPAPAPAIDPAPATSAVQAASAPEQAAPPPAEPAQNKAHLEGLVNVARAQVILAHKSEADMNVLSTLVSNLAEAVDEQEKALRATREQAALAKAETEVLRKEARETADLLRQVIARQTAERSAAQRTASAGTLATGAEAQALGIAPVLGMSLTAHGARGDRLDQVRFDVRPPADATLVRALKDAFAADRFGFALQPIVTLPQRKVRFYEMSLALPGAKNPDELCLAARDANLSARYDRLIVSRALRLIRYFRARQRDITILCQVTGGMLIANPAFDELIAELREDREVARALIIGFEQRDFDQFRQSETDLLRFFSEAGARFAVMQLNDMQLDPQKLAAAGVRLVTIDVRRMVEAIPTGLSGIDVHVADLAGLFARRDIDLVVQNVAREQDLLDVMDLDVPLAQGVHLGEPRPINPELVEAAGQQKPAQALPDATAAAVQRQPLRNFLRRA